LVHFEFSIIDNKRNLLRPLAGISLRNIIFWQKMLIQTIFLRAPQKSDQSKSNIASIFIVLCITLFILLLIKFW